MCRIGLSLRLGDRLAIVGKQLGIAKRAAIEIVLVAKGPHQHIRIGGKIFECIDDLTEAQLMPTARRRLGVIKAVRQPVIHNHRDSPRLGLGQYSLIAAKLRCDHRVVGGVVVVPVVEEAFVSNVDANRIDPHLLHLGEVGGCER